MLHLCFFWLLFLPLLLLVLRLLQSGLASLGPTANASESIPIAVDEVVGAQQVSAFGPAPGVNIAGFSLPASGAAPKTHNVLFAVSLSMHPELVPKASDELIDVSDAVAVSLSMRPGSVPEASDVSVDVPSACDVVVAVSLSMYSESVP